LASASGTATSVAVYQLQAQRPVGKRQRGGQATSVAGHLLKANGTDREKQGGDAGSNSKSAK